LNTFYEEDCFPLNDNILFIISNFYIEIWKKDRNNKFIKRKKKIEIRINSNLLFGSNSNLIISSNKNEGFSEIQVWQTKDKIPYQINLTIKTKYYHS
jgi:hypothetical protein